MKFIKNIYSFIKKYKLKIIIFITWILFIYFNFITYYRLIIFVLIFIFIIIYKGLVKYFENLKITSEKVLDKLLIINKYRNFILWFLPIIENLLLKLVLYKSKILNLFLFLFYIFIINPIKIFFFKFYSVLDIWIKNNIFNILFSRMFGLILSVLIFTNLIFYLKEILNTNIFGVIYFYLLLVSILSEIFKIWDIKEIYEDNIIIQILCKIFLINSINIKSIYYFRTGVNLISRLLFNNNKNEMYLFLEDLLSQGDKGYKKLFNLSYMSIGNTWFYLNSYNVLINRPYYNFYSKLHMELDEFFITIPDYVFFNYYNWNLPLELLNLINKTSEEIVKYSNLMKFNYNYFKLVLFLHWDIQNFLGFDINNTIIINDSDDFFYFEFYDEDYYILSEMEYFEKLKLSKIFWNNNFYINMYYYIHKYNLENKFTFYISKDIFANNIEYKNYKFIFSMKNDFDIIVEYSDYKVPDEYYKNFLEDLYKEWYNLDNEKKKMEHYKNMIKELDYLHNKYFLEKDINK